jgi:hypothetical protein
MTMRNQMKIPQRRSSAPLPVPVTPRDLPELEEEAATLDVDLNAFERVVNRNRGINYYNYSSMSDADVALVRRVGGEIDAVRVRWRSLGQPATDDEISAELGILVQLVAIAGNLNPTLLAHALSANIAELKPSLFALLRGCRAVQSKYQFLNISSVVEEIQKAQRNADRYDYALEKFCLTEFEADLRREIEHREAWALEWKAERKRGKIAEHRQRKAERAEERFWRQWLDGENDQENSGDGTGT